MKSTAMAAFATVLVLGSVMGAFPAAPESGAASGRADNFMIDINIFDNMSNDVTLSGANLTDGPFNITATVGIADGQPDSPGVIVHFLIDSFENGTGVDAGPLNAASPPTVATAKLQWMPPSYGYYNISVIAVNGTDIDNETIAYASLDVFSSDLRLEQFTVYPTLIYVGVQVASLNATVQNHGNIAGTTNVSFTLGNDTPLGFEVVDVPSGQSVNATILTDFAGLGIANGIYNITASMSDIVGSSLVFEDVVILNPVPDVRPTGMDASTTTVTIMRGQTLDVPLTVHIVNNGTADADGFQVLFYETDLLNPLETVSVTDTLPPGGTIDVYWNWTVTDSTPLGDHVVWAGINPLEPAADYFTNVTITVLGVPNVTVQNITADPPSATEGQNVSLTVVLANTGTAGAANLTVHFLDGTSEVGTMQNITVLANSTLTLAPFRVNVGNIAADTSKNYTAAVNGSSMSVMVPARDMAAQLSFGSFSMPQSFRVGGLVAITATVSNTGTADARNVTVDFTDGAVHVATTSPFDLPMGASRQISINATVPGPGDANHTFFAIASGLYTHLAAPAELGRANLTRFVIHMLVPASVSITSFKVNPTKKDNQARDSQQTFSLQIVLSNAGEAASANCTLTITEGKKVIASENITLAGGANATKVYSWKVKGSGSHSAIASLGGADAGSPSISTAKCTLNYSTPGFGLPAALFAIAMIAIFAARRKR